LKLAIVGFGYIGRSYVRALNRKLDLLRSIDDGFKVVGVADIEGYLYNADGLDLGRLSVITKITEYRGEKLYGGSAIELLEKGEIDLLVEATPTNVKDGEPGLTHIVKALTRGIHVVTSNKGPLVVAFRRLMELAKAKGVKLKYEATVAGAIPIFSLVEKCLRGDKIKRIYGILNGTTNYILTRMHFEGVSFQQALKEAQERGIAERDPTLDVEGVDAACKVVILANSLMGKDLKLNDVNVTGITKITPEAITLAKRAGYAIKLIASIDDRRTVAPKLVPLNHPLCVHGTLNAVRFEMDLAGELTLIGRGAGEETVSAMLNDTIDVLT